MFKRDTERKGPSLSFPTNEDQQLHFFLSGNDLIVTSDDIIDRNAESFYPIYVRQYMRDMLEPYLQ